jgi:hypothetical protein
MALVTCFAVIALSPGWSSSPVPETKAIGSSFSVSLFSERRDLRGQFHATFESDSVFKGGAILIIPDGVLEHAKQATTNECPTVQSALEMHVHKEFAKRRQIRLVQKDRITQTPLPRLNSELARQAFMETKLSAGDILIVTRRQF